MKNRLFTFAAAALFAMSIVPFTNNASATPVANVFAIKNAAYAAPTNIETVRWRGRGWRDGNGAGVGAAIVGGAILGGLLAAPYYGYDGPYYGPGYGGNAVAYCMQRFKSYDPGSGTYLGYDGYRHPCP
jgi:BA14K-like protein